MYGYNTIFRRGGYWISTKLLTNIPIGAKSELANCCSITGILLLCIWQSSSSSCINLCGGYWNNAVPLWRPLNKKRKRSHIPESGSVPGEQQPSKWDRGSAGIEWLCHAWVSDRSGCISCASNGTPLRWDPWFAWDRRRLNAFAVRDSVVDGVVDGIFLSDFLRLHRTAARDLIPLRVKGRFSGPISWECLSLSRQKRQSYVVPSMTVVSISQHALTSSVSKYVLKLIEAGHPPPLNLGWKLHQNAVIHYE